MELKHLFAVLLLLVAMTTSAKDSPGFDPNFMLVLREVEGANKQEFGFKQVGPASATLSSGETITMSGAWFDLIGDMHVRFVMDGEHSMQNLTAEEFSALGITPEHAAEIAVSNIKKRYGTPRISPWEDGIMLVSGESPDLDSSYFLDTALWEGLQKEHPQGLIVGVPKRGGLIYAPVSDKRAVSLLERSIRSLYESSESMRVSAALYLYKEGKWSVYRRAASIK